MIGMGRGSVWGSKLLGAERRVSNVLENELIRKVPASVVQPEVFEARYLGRAT